jgi:Helix-turn-helix domain
MGVRHPNPRLVKVHRNYSVEEVARLFGLHKNTVRNWLKLGLAAIDDRRPMLILGRELLRSCTSAGRRPSSPVGRVGFFASHAARPRYRPG